MKTLNLKDPEAPCLAAEISRLTGESMTRAVTTALKEKLDRIERNNSKATTEELRAIAKGIASQVQRPYVDHGALLYDENERRYCPRLKQKLSARNCSTALHGCSSQPIPGSGFLFRLILGVADLQSYARGEFD